MKLSSAFQFQETSILKLISNALRILGISGNTAPEKKFFSNDFFIFYEMKVAFPTYLIFFSKKRLIPWTMELDYEQKYVRISLDICANQLAGGLLLGGLLLKNQKYFEVMLNIFKFSRVWENVESWLLFWIAQPYFSTDLIKRS